MAAKRLGQFLSNVTGTSGQILRVKSDESGFEMFTPAGLPTYTITNDTTDRTIDADVTTADELADVLATLIKDITTLVGGPVAFQWSSSEQVWPFEKDDSGNILYCKQIDCGTLPNSGNSNTSHNIPSLNTLKVHKVEGLVFGPTSTDYALPLNMTRSDGYNYTVSVWMQYTVVTIQTGFNYGTYGWTAKVRVIYAK